MNRGNRDLQRASRLFAAMGEIDGRYLAEALEVRTKKRRTALPISVLSVAASVALVVTLIFGTSRFLFGSPKDNLTESDGLDRQGIAFSELLLACTESSFFIEQTDLRELPLQDGEMRILVGTRTGDRLWVSRSLNESECAVIDREVLLSSQTVPAERTDSADLMIWITDRNGAIWSPEVAYSNGNVTFGNLYDYDPEREPSDAFCNLLIDLIS